VNESILEGLTAEQAEAVKTVEGPVAVVAGPGTGKTRVLTRRAAWLISEAGGDPERILTLTFTTRAAEEIRERLEGLLGPGRRLPFAGTFHAFGLLFLKTFTGEEVRIADPEAVSRLAGKVRPGEGAAEAARTLKSIFHLKEAGVSPERAAAAGESASEYYAAYEAAKEEEGLLDLADLVLRPLEILRGNEKRRREAAEKWPHLLVDEFQDVNRAQFELVDILSGTGRGLFVIGDPNQAIYGFRGASSRAFDELKRRRPSTRVLVLTSNWRSTGTIVEASKAVLDEEGRRTAQALRAAGEAGPRIVIKKNRTPKAEAVWVTRTVERLMGGTSLYAMDSGRADSSFERDLSFGDIAVLYRTNVQGDHLEAAFRESGLPYRRFLSSPPTADPAVRAFLAAARKEIPLSREAASLAAFRTDEEQPPNIQGIRARAARFHGTLQEFLASVSFFRAEDVFFSGSHLALMTMHGSKGLEFEAVFITGLARGVFPPPETRNPEEERRLLYVAMTRARWRLFLSWFAEGRVGGGKAEGESSPFLQDIDRRKVEFSGLDSPKRRHRGGWRQLDLFDA